MHVEGILAVQPEMATHERGEKREVASSTGYSSTRKRRKHACRWTVFHTTMAAKSRLRVTAHTAMTVLTPQNLRRREDARAVGGLRGRAFRNGA